MIECIYRIPVEKSKTDQEKSQNVGDAMAEAWGGQCFSAGFVGTLRQTFCNGLCQLLTVNDIGPLECQQPEHNEKTCPDIEEYREK